MSTFNQDLLQYVSRSPTPFHAVFNTKSRLLKAGFIELNEASDWPLEAGQRYFVTRRDTSLVAFIYGLQPMQQAGLRLLGAHTDSPCLKVKPAPDITRKGYKQLGIEIYGGVLMAPWFDRDLSLAGQVSVVDSLGELHHLLVDVERPIATIPSLAIHLDREANSQRTINPQDQLPPILWQTRFTDNDMAFRDWLVMHLRDLEHDVAQVLDFELSFYDVQAGAEIGLHQEFMSCARLDNLLSCYVTIESLLQSSGEVTSLVVLNDHEEVGSCSTAGADGNFLECVLERLLPDAQARQRALSQSMMMSVDNAHGVHPNFIQKHDDGHGPLLNDGPVLKFNANQSYASQSAMSSRIRLLAQQENIPIQSFVMRSDMRCGSTIGPMTAAKTGIETLDIGVPTFAMHSIRELAGAHDSILLNRLLTAFLNYY